MELFYQKYGKGDPVIILHGIFGISDNWVTIGKRIAEKFTVFIPDQRNHGRSPHSPVFNYEALIADLQEFIENHGISHPVIIGHSLGGKVAMRFALEYPQDVSRLISIDMSPRKYRPRKTHSDIINAMLSVDFNAITSRKQVDEIISRSVENIRVRRFIMKNLDRVGKTNFNWRINIDAINNNLEEVFKGIESSSTFDKPTLFIGGGNSDYITKDDYPDIYQFFPEAEIKTIKNATHWVHADEPDELCKTLSEFLNKECVFNPGKKN